MLDFSLLLEWKGQTSHADAYLTQYGPHLRTSPLPGTMPSSDLILSQHKALHLNQWVYRNNLWVLVKHTQCGYAPVSTGNLQS